MPGPKGSHSLVSNQLTAKTIKLIFNLGSQSWYRLSLINNDAPLINPKPTSTTPAQATKLVAINTPPTINNPFQIMRIGRFLILMEKNQWAKGGMSVITIIIAATRAKVFVNASGRNSLPSAATIVNTGRKLTIVIVIAVIIACATSLDARYITSRSDSSGSARFICCSIFSDSTIPISTMVPMAMAIPDRDTMLASTPANFIAIKVINTATGSIPEIRMDVRKFSTITTITMMVINTSSESASSSVPSVS